MNEERRRDARLTLTLPCRVNGQDATGAAWEEMGSVRDVSLGGASLMLRHEVPRGQVLFLSLPLPKRFRRYDVAEPSYRVYALVRDLTGHNGGGNRVGVMFLGKQPPRGYEKGVGGLFMLPTDSVPAGAPRERRHGQRHEIFVNFRVRPLPAAQGTDPRAEQTVAENIGRGGARVMTSLTVGQGDIVWLEEMGGSFHTRAEVRNTYVGPDRIPRLNLRFLDAPPPDRLVPPETAA